MATKPNHYGNVPHFEGEFTEIMMKDGKTYPPMKVWDDSLKYVLKTLGGKLFPWCRPTVAKVEAIYRGLKDYVFEHFPENDPRRGQMIEGIKRFWPGLREKLLKNAGLVAFMNDHGIRSESFAIFPAELVPRAIALESAFGNNYNNAKVYGKLAPGCISSRCAAVEPEFVELRRRAYYAKGTIFEQFPELKNYADHPAPKKLGRVITLGAGLLIEFRKFGWTLSQIQSLDIIACDLDETLLEELDVVFQHDFGVPFKESGIDYRICSIENVLADKTLYGTAVVVLIDGVLSYCRDKRHMLEYVRGAAQLLKPDGYIFCDWQVLEISLIRCAVVQCWESTMKPSLTPGIAVRIAKWIAKELGLSIIYIKVDDRNPRPLGVIARYELK